MSRRVQACTEASGLSMFLNQFGSLPVALLGAAAGVSILTGVSPTRW